MSMRSFSLPESDASFLVSQMRTDVQGMETELASLVQRKAPASAQRELNEKITRMKRLINTLS